MKLALGSIKTRLTLLFVSIFVIFISVFSYFLYQHFIENQQIQFDANLYNHAVDVSKSIDINFFGFLSIDQKALNHETKLLPFPMGTTLLAVRDNLGSVLVRSQKLSFTNLHMTKSEIDSVIKSGATFKNINVETGEGGEQKKLFKGKSIRYRMINFLINKEEFGRPLILQLAAPLSVVDSEKKELIKFFILVIPLMAAFSLVTGYLFSNRALQPVNQIINKTKSIEIKSLKERVPVPDTEDEIFELANTINSLLNRLEQSFLSQDRFVADASHQIKTPLAILKGELELMQRGGRTEADVDEFLKSASQEINTLTKIVEDLLLLARIEAGKEYRDFGKAAPVESALEQVSRLSKKAREKNIFLDVHLDEGESSPDCELEIAGDSDLLGILFYNLIENAIKYSPNDSKVEMRFSKDQNFLVFSVKDEGPGLPKGEEEKIFNRFYRNEQVQTKESGSGLGLHIARQIAELHNSHLVAVSDKEKGAEFKVKFPLS